MSHDPDPHRERERKKRRDASDLMRRMAEAGPGDFVEYYPENEAHLDVVFPERMNRPVKRGNPVGLVLGFFAVVAVLATVLALLT